MVGPPAKKPVPPTEGVPADTAEGPKSPALAPKDADVSAKVQSPIENTAPAVGSPAPDWASASGSDRFGRWAEISIEPRAGVTVVQRLRWIVPGRFQMGSRPDEPEREHDEARDEVWIRGGFWLFDTACTQALWEAVMGENPAHFEGAQRPVECVSWDDVQRFISTLNGRLPGLGLSLPSEA